MNELQAGIIPMLEQGQSIGKLTLPRNYAQMTLGVRSADLEDGEYWEGTTPSPDPHRLKITPAVGHPLPQGGEGVN